MLNTLAKGLPYLYPACCWALANFGLDHIIARSRGGQDTLNNLVAACETCNISKNYRDMETWYRSRPYFDEERLAYILSIAKGD